MTHPSLEEEDDIRQRIYLGCCYPCRTTSQSGADGERENGEKKWQLSETQGQSSPKCHPWAGCLPSSIFFQLGMFPKESFSIPSVYRRFPGAVVKMLALKGEKQDASLCKWPFSGEIMLFPKVRVHCCWATAKSSFPTPSGGDNNAHVCHFLISVEIAGLIFTAEKKN